MRHEAALVALISFRACMQDREKQPWSTGQIGEWAKTHKHVERDEGQTHLGGDTADLNEAEAHHHELLGSLRLLVAPRSQAQRVAELSAKNCGKQNALPSGAATAQAQWQLLRLSSAPHLWS